MFWNHIIVAVFLTWRAECYEITLSYPTEDGGSNSGLYRLDPEMIRSKEIWLREGKILRKSKVHLIISGLESSLSWSDLVQGEKRLAVGFQLLQGKKYVENVVLYTPRDVTYRALGLKDSMQYTGTVRLIRDQYEIQQSNSSSDIYNFRMDSPRIIQEKEVNKILQFISNIRTNRIKLDSSSVTFKLLNRIREHFILEVHNLNETSVISKTEIHVVPNSKTIILNDLPPNSILRMVLRRYNSTSSSEDATTFHMFTGSLTTGEDMVSASSITRLVIYNRDRLEQNQQNNIPKEEKTVPCHVVNRRPFNGYPCPQSQVCLPLHWRCDGQQDCPNGLDEVGCELYSSRSESLISQDKTSSICKAHEATCIHNNTTMCIPNSWLCDGRTDCDDGWDEKQENCPPKATTYTIPALTQGIKRITNLLLRCRGAHFRCRSGECISDRSACDGVNHCDDASDELYCNGDDDDDEDYETEYIPDYEFKCHPTYEYKCYRSYSYSNKRCIPKAWLCDAFQDCPYGEDENTNFCSHQHLFQGYFN